MTPTPWGSYINIRHGYLHRLTAPSGLAFLVRAGATSQCVRGTRARRSAVFNAYFDAKVKTLNNEKNYKLLRECGQAGRFNIRPLFFPYYS